MLAAPRQNLQPPRLHRRQHFRSPRLLPCLCRQGTRQTRRKLSPVAPAHCPSVSWPPQHEAAMLTTFNEVDMSAVMALPSKIQDDSWKKTASTWLHVVFHQGRRSMRSGKFPAVNAQSKAIHRSRTIFLISRGLFRTEKGLIGAGYTQCETLGWLISRKTSPTPPNAARRQDHTRRSRRRRLTITNGGTSARMLRHRIINSPQSAILGLQCDQ